MTASFQFMGNGHVFIYDETSLHHLTLAVRVTPVESEMRGGDCFRLRVCDSYHYAISPA